MLLDMKLSYKVDNLTMNESIVDNGYHVLIIIRSTGNKSPFTGKDKRKPVSGNYDIVNIAKVTIP